MKTTSYKRCTRCELNYIKKGEKYCSVCQTEIEKKNGEQFDIDLQLCPICKCNYISEDEVMCAQCFVEHEGDKELDDIDKEAWRQYIDDDAEEVADEEEELGAMAGITDLEDDNINSDLEIDIDLGNDLEFDEIDAIAKDEFSDAFSEEEDFDDDSIDDLDEEDFDDDDDDDDDDDVDDDDDDDDDYDDDDDDDDDGDDDDDKK